MANRTQVGVVSVKGQNPQFLFDAIIRQKVYASRYWKEDCTGLTAESLVDEAIKLEYVGGTYGGTQKPTRFLILVLKMLQIQPDKDIIIEFMRNKDFKYVTALAMFYWRMIADQEEVYEEIENLLSDNRKLRYRLQDGKFKILYMDEFADELLTQEVCCSIKLPHLQKRLILEELGRIKPRISPLEEELILEEQDEEKQDQTPAALQTQDKQLEQPAQRQLAKERSPSRSRSRSKKHKKHKKDKSKWRQVVSKRKDND